jgi:glycosyltransferase involved in cell wall biosynthesis
VRVLVFTNMYPFEEMPYYGSFVRDEVEALRRRGVQVEVLFVNGLKNKAAYFAMPWRFARALRRGFDLIHVHHSYCGAVAVMQRGLPVVWTFHEGEILSPPEVRGEDRPIKALVYSHRFKRWVARRVDRLVVEADRFKEALGRPDAVTLPAGIDLDRFRPMDAREAKARLGLDPERRYLLFPSSPKRIEKRYPLARETVALLKKRGIELELICLEGVPHEEVPWYINASEAVLMTSAFEASPVTVREALACDRPVVSTDVGDVREVLAEIEGCAVVEADPEALADAVERALQAGPRVKGRERVEETSLDRTAERLIRLYRDLLEDRRRHGGRSG